MPLIERASTKPDRVVTEAGAMLLVSPAGGSTPITLGEADACLAEGWQVTKVYAEASCFSIVDLLHITGATSFWILNAAGKIIGNDHDFTTWPEHYSILQDINSHVEAIASDLIEHAESAFGSAALSFYELSKSTRLALLSALERRSTSVEIIDLAIKSDKTSWVFDYRSNELSIRHGDLMPCLHVHLDERFIEALKTKKLRWPMLTQVGLSDSVHCLFFDYSMAVLRVLEPETRLVFYVVVEGADLVPFGIFVPTIMTTFSWSTGLQNVAFGRLERYPDWVVNRLRKILLCGPEAVLTWLQSAPVTTGHFLWPGDVAHLGHYIWNELTGVEKIVQAIPHDCLPTIWNLASIEQSSFYGPLENIYPELKGHIRKATSSMEELFANAVRTGTQFVRVSGSIVTERIRSRIVSALRDDPDLQIIEKVAQPFFLPGTPILLLGLRCGTRTIKNLALFYSRVIDAVHAKFGNLAIIVDGLNSPPGAPQGGTFQVYISGKSSMGPIESEQEIAKVILRHCDRRGIACINCVGASMKQSLHWISKADFFVSPWGGGLAKYRWVFNIPGYALTNKHNLRHPFILSIYHSSRFMEAGSPLHYPEAAWITDVTDALATGDGWQSDAMFDVDDAVIDDIVTRFASNIQTVLDYERLIDSPSI